MTERQFEASGAAGQERCDDYGLMCDELRCHSSESLHLARREAIAEQRWWRLRELAITAVLDERGQVDDSTAGTDGTTTKTARRTRRTAAKLTSQPKVAEAAAKGRMLDGRFSLPDVDGATFESVLDEMIEKMRPAAGRAGIRGSIAGPTPSSSCAASTATAGVSTSRHRGRSRISSSRSWPASWGGSDDLYNLACLCSFHHALMAPQGRVLLLGNPNNPAGLTLLDRDDLPKLAQLAAEQSRADTAA